MTILFDAPVHPDALVTFIRESPLPSDLKLSALFPTTTADTNTVDFAEITQTNRTARYRTFDGRIHTAERDGFSDKRVAMAPFSDSLNMGEYERLQLEFARTGGTRYGALANAVYNDTERLVRNMRNRVEQALADVLLDGKFTPAELNGMETDFGVPAGHLPAQLATPWSTIASADILADLITACDTYEATNGFRPGRIITSRRITRYVQTATKVINAVKGAQTGVTRVALSDFFPILENEGVPTDWMTYETQLDVDGVTTRLIPDDRVIFLPPNPSDLMEFRFGVSATALELVNSNESDMSFADAPGIVGVVEKVGPPYRQFTFVDAVGMPIMKDAKKLFVLDVA